jgi:hypothetical protein
MSENIYSYLIHCSNNFVISSKKRDRVIVPSNVFVLGSFKNNETSVNRQIKT